MRQTPSLVTFKIWKIKIVRYVENPGDNSKDIECTVDQRRAGVACTEHIAPHHTQARARCHGSVVSPSSPGSHLQHSGELRDLRAWCKYLHLMITQSERGWSKCKVINELLI